MTVSTIKGWHIEGRRWSSRTYGNTYHSVRIYGDGVLKAHLPPRYGYGEQCLQTAWEWLALCHHLPKEYGGTIGLREHQVTYSIVDVPRERDL